MYDQLRSFDASFQPRKGGSYQDRPKVADLSDGEYDFEIVSASLEQTGRTGEPIFRMELKVLSPGEHQGTTVERPTFFRRQESVDWLGGELAILGFDVDQWTPANGRPFSQELDKAARAMTGLCFHAEKVTNGQYANLYFRHRLGGPKAPSSTPTRPAPPVPPAPPLTLYEHGKATTDDIPF